jgi:hypothetical protein
VSDERFVIDVDDKDGCSLAVELFEPTGEYRPSWRIEIGRTHTKDGRQLSRPMKMGFFVTWNTLAALANWLDETLEKNPDVFTRDGVTQTITPDGEVEVVK